MRNYYEILEVNPKASTEVIKKAHQVLVKRYHPDLYAGEERMIAEQKLRDVNEAYKILSDDFLREQYDAEIEREKNYARSYSNTQNIKNRKKVKEEEEINQKQKETAGETNHKVGTLMSLMDLVKNLFGNKSKVKKTRNIEKEDLMAAGLTIVIVVILGIILWFIPATNGFIRSLIPFI